jgi:hypothetical protein
MNDFTLDLIKKTTFFCFFFLSSFFKIKNGSFSVDVQNKKETTTTTQQQEFLYDYT